MLYIFKINGVYLLCIISQSQLVYKRQQYQQNLMKDHGKQTEDVKEMVSRVLNQDENWSKHLAHSCCKCQKCTCGKHKCKFQSPKIGLKPSNSTYHDDYQNRKSVGHFQPMRKDYDVYHPKQFIKKSQYREEYYRKKAKLDSNRPAHKKEDNITLGGPNFAGTTYNDSFTPKNNAKTDPIKNPQNLGNSGMRMNTNSHYRDTYKGKNNKGTKANDGPIKHKDNLKSQGVTFGGVSSYMQDFTIVKPYKKEANFAPKNQYTSVHGVRPKSSYNCDYTQKKIPRCPAETCCC